MMLARRLLALLPLATAFLAARPALPARRQPSLRSASSAEMAFVCALDHSTLLAAADLPDPRIPVVFFAFLLVAFGVTQAGIIGVVREEDKLGAEPGRKALDQMARRRGYFKK